MIANHWSNDGMVAMVFQQLWSHPCLRLRATLQGHSSSVHSTHWSFHGKFLVMKFLSLLTTYIVNHLSHGLFHGLPHICQMVMTFTHRFMVTNLPHGDGNHQITLKYKQIYKKIWNDYWNTNVYMQETEDTKFSWNIWSRR